VIILGTYMLNYIQIMAQCKNNVNEVSQLSHFILVVFKYVVLKSLLLLLRLQMGKVRDGFGGMVGLGCKKKVKM